METIFECENLGGEPGFRRVRRREYYEGEYQILPSSNINVRIEKGFASTYSIINLRSSSPLKFRRTWQHIRRDKADVSVLWFVKRGSIVFSRSSGNHVIKSGQCMVSRSLQPFQMNCLIDDEARHEVLHIVVPAHLLSCHFPIEHGTTFSCQEGEGRLALRTFELLYDEGSSVSQNAADGLAWEAMKAIGSIFSSAKEPLPRSVADKRFLDILSFVQSRLGNPSLSADVVARGVGISYRYLLHILKSHNTSFSDVLWTGRLDRARNWLAAENMRHLSISQISYMAGFKSPAHFSRMFKSATSTTPRDFRIAKGTA
jgi:AraC-like DNA-binding protein